MRSITAGSSIAAMIFNLPPHCGQRSISMLNTRFSNRAQLIRKTPTVKAWFARHARFHVHFTPTSGSWLNLVERWFALLSQRQIKRGSHRSTVELEKAIRHYLAIHNHNPKPFVWHKTADEIIDSVGRFCKRINDSLH
jgi:hypothetical protein